MLSSESVAIAIVIQESSYMKELKFEVDVVKLLRSLGFDVIYRG
ncbi:16672_t:CDS:1, partial [Cetraspora pellucida]